MSVWPRPTTADIALRAFSSSPERLLVEAGLGMQEILMSEGGMISASSATRSTGEWVLDKDSDESYERILVRFLEEILFRCEVEEKWFVDGAVMIYPENIRIQVSWVDADLIEREVEIKAVTMHELTFSEIIEGELVVSNWADVPDFQGPGWYCDVVFDI